MDRRPHKPPQPPPGGLHRNGGGGHSGDELSGNPHSMKVRRLQQSLFLREMERLADAMCRHYVDARGDVDTVSAGDIRAHIDTIHDRVHHTIHRDLTADPRLVTALGGATELSMRDHGEWSTAIGGGGTPLSRTGASTPRDPRSGARPLGPKSEWTAQEARGVALRLRNMTTVSVASQQQYRQTAHTARAAVQPTEEPLLQVHRFETDDARQVGLLDINMDGNTQCLSARRRVMRPEDAAVADAVRARNQQLMVKPRAPAVRFPRERVETLPSSGILDDDGEASVPGASSYHGFAGSSVPGANATSGLRDFGVSTVGRAKAKWSPRDALSKYAESTKRSGASRLTDGAGGLEAKAPAVPVLPALQGGPLAPR